MVAEIRIVPVAYMWRERTGTLRSPLSVAPDTAATEALGPENARAARGISSQFRLAAALQPPGADAAQLVGACRAVDRALQRADGPAALDIEMQLAALKLEYFYESAADFPTPWRRWTDAYDDACEPNRHTLVNAAPAAKRFDEIDAAITQLYLLALKNNTNRQPKAARRRLPGMPARVNGERPFVSMRSVSNIRSGFNVERDWLCSLQQTGPENLEVWFTGATRARAESAQPLITSLRDDITRRLRPSRERDVAMELLTGAESTLRF